MSKRIRYQKSSDNVLSSIRTFISDKTGAEYRVFIHLDKVEYIIQNIKDQRNYYGGENVNNMNVLKRNIKKRLEGMGVSFDTEYRERTFGLCEKGHTQKKEVNEKK